MSDHDFNKDFCRSDVHHWFSLTYSSYFAMPRSVMQSMSAEWQHEFVRLMNEVQELYGGYEMDYKVIARNDRGGFVRDPLRDYERGRRFVEPKPYEWASTPPASNEVTTRKEQDKALHEEPTQDAR